MRSTSTAHHSTIRTTAIVSASHRTASTTLAVHTRGFHPTTISAIRTTSMSWHAILAMHPTTTLVTTSFRAILMMATGTMASPIELIVARRTLNRSSIEAHEDILGDLMIRELNKAIAYKV